MSNVAEPSLQPPLAQPSLQPPLAALAGRFLTNVAHLQALRISLRAAGPGWAELQLPTPPQLAACAGGMEVASGALFTLLDTCAGLAVILRRGTGEPQVTVDLRLDYLRAATVGRDVIGRVECYRMTPRVAFVRGLAHEGDAARPLAHVAGPFMFPGPAAVRAAEQPA